MNPENQDTAIVVAKPAEVSLGTLYAATPEALVAGATQAANALKRVIVDQKLTTRIGPKDYVRCEGWTTLATMMGLMPREVDNQRLEDGSYIATVELVRMSDGQVMSRATSECGMDEPAWANRPNYARRSMAATRATGKACRLALSWVMALAGYEATPAEEMMDITPPRTAPQAPPPARPRTMANRDEADADAPVGAAVVPFGKNKGTPVTELSDSSLSWYHERAIKADDPNETDWLVALENEIDRRKQPKNAEIPF